ncbi:hypothetical protein S7711_00515 [Stachybotrys chartarum IBT 7711]|uniref:DNA2/NAM7 helicase-like C-terminal domain-containing protein n=1 Tax=Stachybotrys chartarum (strain CBS 109288 / IBT 7711) TaxID=1280523 RepID=A0A084ATK6_STACB|nr:hypothetical protein S7711_00515 [Stachybotrys chartarum IBT 7711]KFA49640.1 hypothetical protein S40293_01393 [Stachybotrys chartarum IBT 40293]
MTASLDRVTPSGSHHAAVPLHTFPNEDIYASRLEQGTLIEMRNETQSLKLRNERRTDFEAWPVAPFPGLQTAFVTPWLFLVRTPGDDDVPFPALSDSFKMDLDVQIQREDGNYSLVHLHSVRITNPYDDGEESQEQGTLKNHAAFRVDVPRSWKNDDGEHLEMDLMAQFQIIPQLERLSYTMLSQQNRLRILITWDESSLTFEAELAALRFLTEAKRNEDRGPSCKSRRVFAMIQNFHVGWKDFFNLQEVFPHLQNPYLSCNRIPKLVLDKFRAFTPDHQAAYEGLTRIPNGLYFVNGCPGAGKTEWNMVTSALIQARSRPGQKRQRTRILYLVDLNQAVDDAANRYFRLCRDAGMNIRVIRMHGWPYEMRHSVKMNTGPALNDEASVEDGNVDFTKKFLTTASFARHAKPEKYQDRAPTLDEAAWAYYERHARDCFEGLYKLLTRMDKGEALTSDDWKALRSLVGHLYRAVLAQADFVATTPVATYGRFSKLFRPDIIFVDEAPHARELTTLIPIAFFDPFVWILTGDVNQTRPFVKSGNRAEAQREGLTWNPFAGQLRYSLMARAASVNAINSRLIINKRAYGNLHRLPSKLFYNGEMISGYGERAFYPASTLHLKRYLEKLNGGREIDETRIIVHLHEGNEEKQNASFWNPQHHDWLIGQVRVLLQDPGFCGASTPKHLGTIMIQTPYRTAWRRYQAEVQQWSPEWRSRVKVLTVDKAQGCQADVVFLDLVRTSQAGFMDDAQRLNVAITRARQAEIILMHPYMTLRTLSGKRVRSQYTSQLWDDAVNGKRLISLEAIDGSSTT